MMEFYDPSRVTDLDTPFYVDPITREIKSKKLEKKILMKNDHNSERFRFEIPRYMEGRDVGLCNVVQVCYLNIDEATREQVTGVYTVDDLNIYPFYNDILTCSWLISQNVTSHAGSLSFMLRFAQVEGTTVKYAWHTKPFEDVSVAETLDSASVFEHEYVDIIQQWKDRVMSEMYNYVDIVVKNNVNVAQIDVNKNNIADLANDAAVTKARMDEFSKLPEGSTSGDAELADIRIGANGKTYKNAGEAVREQFNEVKKENAYGYVFLNRIPKCTFVENDYVELTLPDVTEVFCNGTIYSPNNLTAKCSISNNRTLFAVLFNYKDLTMSIQYFKNDIPDNCVIIGTIFKGMLNLNSYGTNNVNDQSIDSYNSVVAMVWTNYSPTFTWAVDEGTDDYGRALWKLSVSLPAMYMYTGNNKHYIPAKTAECIVPYDTSLFVLLYNPDGNEVLVESRAISKARHGYYQIGMVHSTYGVFLNGGTSFANIHNMALAPLILGRGEVYVEFDSVAKTVTFPDDTLVLVNKDTSQNPKYYQLSDTNNNRTISYADQTSSALIIMLDTTTNKLAITKYDYYVPQNCVVIASFRTYNGRVSINAPYTWDGKVMNLDAKTLGIEIPDIADVMTEFVVKSVNHRGYCTEAPENTLSAYRLSAKNGFRYVECDVSFTKDNIPVLLHDSTIDRTSNGSGNIQNLTLDQVRAYDFGSWFDSKYAGEKIPTFEEFIALCRKLSLHPYIEIKSSTSFTQEQVDILINIVKRYGMTGKVTYISFSSVYLGYVKNTDPNARLGYVVDSVTDSVISVINSLKTDTNEVFADANVSVLTTAMVELCIAADIPLEVWTCNDADHIDSILDPYVSGVTSDDVHAGKILFKNNL